jgi:hypothetical protein
MPFNIVYIQEVVIQLQFWTNIDMVAAIEKFNEGENLNDQLYHLNKLDEERLISIHYQEVKKK